MQQLQDSYAQSRSRYPPLVACSATKVKLRLRPPVNLPHRNQSPHLDYHLDCRHYRSNATVPKIFVDYAVPSEVRSTERGASSLVVVVALKTRPRDRRAMMWQRLRGSKPRNIKLLSSRSDQ
jgi:hypothetical protein